MPKTLIRTSDTIDVDVSIGVGLPFRDERDSQYFRLFQDKLAGQLSAGFELTLCEYVEMIHRSDCYLVNFCNIPNDIPLAMYEILPSTDRIKGGRSFCKPAIMPPYAS